MKKYTISTLFALLSFVLCLSSCEDILTVDSTRYVTVDENELKSPNDSVHSILGLLRGLQDVAERYILLGEMRADLLDVTVYTPAGIRALSNFTVNGSSEYANPRDYYAIINNCNYFISRTSDPDSPLKAENAQVHAIRAWTYMQVVFNWGKASYFTEPLLSVEDTKKSFPQYGIPQVVDALIADLEPFADTIYPYYGEIYNFSSSDLFFPAKVLLGDLYLWRGSSTDDYEKAAACYAEYIDSKTTTVYSPAIRWNYNNFLTQNFENSYPQDDWLNACIASLMNTELVTAVQMAEDASEGKTSHLRRDYTAFSASGLINTLWDDQNYVLHYVSDTETRDYFTTGDLRKQANIFGMVIIENDEVALPVLSKIQQADHILLYRLGGIYLRYAEAVNRAGKPHTAFAVLKYGLSPLTLMDETKIPREELADAKPYITLFNAAKYENAEGIHARGCGNSAYDIRYVIGDEYTTPEDKMLQVEDLICTELALETSFEGNRFQDLMRMALRRNDPSFLARRVAAKHEAADYDRIYNLLSSDINNWFLPEPEKP